LALSLVRLRVLYPFFLRPICLKEENANVDSELGVHPLLSRIVA